MSEVTTEKTDARGSSGAILCVDDEPSILSSLRRTLRRGTGYTVYTADSGRAGLDILEQHPVDVVVSDMRMPEMDGAEFLSNVSQRWPDTVRILLTGYADLRSTVDAVNDAGIFRYLHKPWEDIELKLALSQALELRHLEFDRRHALESAWAANQARDEFLANMSHELKTPLHAVLSCCRLSERAVESSDTDLLTESISRIRKNGELLLHLVSELLDLSKLEVNAQALEVSMCDLVLLTNETIDELQGLASEKRLALSLRAPDEVRVQLDRIQFAKVLRNVIGNAIKYARLDGCVEVEIELVEQTVSLTVTDDGPGVPGDELGLIFEKFVQSSQTKSGAGGTGLGLAIAKGIVLAHGGAVDASNCEPNGLRVHIRLPQVPCPSA